MTAPTRFDDGGHVTIRLRIITGPAWDTTRVYCTCGWDRTYKTEAVALRREAKHLADHEPVSVRPR
ncbi:hypothetical protein GS504_15905 [Rhodococcus hoagii]|nr:hypothetical protein [Prescottella equi]